MSFQSKQQLPQNPHVFSDWPWEQDYVNTAETVCKSRLKTSQEVGHIANHLMERMNH